MTTEPDTFPDGWTWERNPDGEDLFDRMWDWFRGWAPWAMAIIAGTPTNVTGHEIVEQIRYHRKAADQPNPDQFWDAYCVAWAIFDTTVWRQDVAPKYRDIIYPAEWDHWAARGREVRMLNLRIMERRYGVNLYELANQPFTERKSK